MTNTFQPQIVKTNLGVYVFRDSSLSTCSVLSGLSLYSLENSTESKDNVIGQDCPRSDIHSECLYVALPQGVKTNNMETKPSICIEMNNVIF